MSATNSMPANDSENFMNTESDMPASDPDAWMHRAYIVVEEPYQTLSEALVDIEAQLIDGERTAWDDLQAMHDSLPLYSPPPPPETTPASPPATFTGPANDESGSDSSGSDSSSEDSGSDGSDSGTHSEGSESGTTVTALNNEGSGSGTTVIASNDEGSGGDVEMEEGAADEGSFRLITHNVRDWTNNPPRWDGQAIPEMDVVDEVHEYIHNTFVGDQNYPTTCKMSVLNAGDPAADAPCGHVINTGKGTLRRHIWSQKHLGVLKHCPRCNHHERPDNTRHSCTV
ncbi:hypothetical protein C8T65DRAFT_112415 [Cerioporus squamosus]|nr:hypothetical protein C8T65DRAFT_112415 [Cerioporus squamosus]